MKIEKNKYAAHRTVPVQRFLDTKVNSVMETFRLADQIIHQQSANTAGGVKPGFVLWACFVMAIGSLLKPDDVPELHRDLVREREFDNAEGGSYIIAPGGKVIATAPANEETILIASVTLEEVLQLKSVIDVGAHYSRPDVLQLHIDRRLLERVVNRSLWNPLKAGIHKCTAKRIQM